MTSGEIERHWGSKAWEYKYEKHNKDQLREIVPPTNPDASRAIRITREIVEAMHKAFGLESEVRVSGVFPGREKLISHEEGKLKKGNLGKSKWHRLVRYGTEHLEGLDWEVMVVESDMKNAGYIPFGRIQIYTRMLKDGLSDAELATAIAHEVGHGVARHSFGTIFKEFMQFHFNPCFPEKLS